jgi:hypothetical protein
MDNIKGSVTLGVNINEDDSSVSVKSSDLNREEFDTVLCLVFAKEFNLSHSDMIKLLDAGVGNCKKDFDSLMDEWVRGLEPKVKGTKSVEKHGENVVAKQKTTECGDDNIKMLSNLLEALFKNE